ncbi:MAG: hypothetical protein P1U89_20255 [Verrucomicrobiales bacterium]|nr:hypothetical protein [Verrucomicrobiales bacterium]
MTLHLELTADQASWLGKEAAQQGIDAAEVLIAALEQKRSQNDPFHGLSDDQTTLEREIGTKLPESIQARYEELSLRCRDEKLTVDEHGELIELNSIIERHHAARIARIAKLAKIQDIEFAELASRFGIVREIK